MVLQRYLTDLILAYARRYIRNIEAQLSLGLWGGDVVLQNLDLRLDVLQRELGVPDEFAFSRGFISEMRIHIPWTALTYKPVEVTLTDVQCVLRFNAAATQTTAHPATHAAPPAASPSSSAIAPPQLAADEAAEVGGSGWAADLVTKILANLTVRILGLSFSFVEEFEEDARHNAHTRAVPTPPIPLPPPSLSRISRQVLLSLRVSSVLLQSTNSGFEVEFMDLEGPWKLMHKTCEITHVCIFLGEIPPEQQREAALAATADASSSADAITAKLSLPDDAVILRDMSFTVRIRAYLAALGGSSLLRLPSAESAPPASCGAAVTLDVHLHQAVDLHLSDQQLMFLMHIIETKANLMTSTDAATHTFPTPAASAAATADPLAIAHAQQHGRSSAPAIITANSLQHILFVDELQPTKRHSPAALHASPLSATTAVADPDPAPSPKGWTSWLWGIVGEDDESATDRASRPLNPAAEFHASFGHLAPRDELVLCFQVPAVSLHLANMKQAAPTFSFHGANAGPRTNPEARRNTSATVLPSARRSAASLLAPFASVHVHEFGLQLSRQLLLPSPLGPPSRFASPPPPPSLRPPLFSIDLVSIALVDETEAHAGRPVLMCGHEQWVRSTFRFMTRGWHDAETAAMLAHRRAPFEASPCLQQRRQWRDKGSKQSSSTHSPHMGPLSTSHHALPSFSSLASSTASLTSRLPTSASSGNTSAGSDEDRPARHPTAEEESMAVHGLSVMRSVIPVCENPHDPAAPVSHYRCTTDVLIGPVACVLDLSCSGQSAMVEQLFAFLDLEVTTGQIGKSRRAKFNRQTSASHATRAEHSAAPWISRHPSQIAIPPHPSSSVVKSRHPRLLFEHRIILLHAVAGVRVHDAAEWKSDQLYLPHVDTLMLELAGARLCNAWHTQHTPSITQRLDGLHVHKLCLGFRQLQFHDDVWSERKPKLKDFQPTGMTGPFSVSSSGEESWSDIGMSSPQHSLDVDLDDDDGLRLLDLSALRVDLSVPALRLQSVSSDSFNNSAIAYFLDAILHQSGTNNGTSSSTSTSPLPSRTASPKLRPRNVAPTPSTAEPVSAVALIPATAEVSMSDLRLSFSLRQLHFLFLVTGAVCGLYAPSLQALLVRLRPRASHIQMDERLTDSLLRLEIKAIRTKLEVPFQAHWNLADAAAAGQQLYWNFSVGSLVTSIERGGKRRNLAVAPFDRYDAPNAADAAASKKDPNAADPPLLSLSFSATQDVLNWFLAIFGVSTLSARSPTLVSSHPPSSLSASPSLNSAVLHVQAIAVVLDSIWLDMAVFFAALTTHIRAGLANYLRAAPQRSQAAGINKQHSYTDLQAMASYPASPADFSSHKSFPPSPVVNDDLLTSSSSTIGQFVHLLLATFLNLFRVRLTLDPVLVCFPLNDRFHLRKHPFAFRYEDVTPMVLRMPQLHILSSPHNAHTNSMEVNLYLRHAHIYAHRQQLRAQTGAGGLTNQAASFRPRKSRSLRLDNYFLATAESIGLISDVLSPWSLELSARCTLAPSSTAMLPSHSAWRLSHVEITVVTKPLSISFTMQHALAVSMIVDSLRAMNVEAPAAVVSSPHAPRATPDPSSQQATAAWADVHHRQRAERTVPAGAAFSASIISDQYPYHPSSSLVLAYPLPSSVHTALLPISYHLTLSTGKLTARLYPKCETADQLLASDMVKFDLSGIAGELACDHTFRWKQAQIAVSLSRLVYLPWQTRMAQHPVHHLFVSNGILASLDRVDIPMRDDAAQPHVRGFALSPRTEVVQAHAFIQPIEVMINMPALTQLAKLFASTAPTAHKFVNDVRPAPRTPDVPVSHVSDRKTTLERTPASGGTSGTLQPVQLWVCIQVERIRLALPAPVVAATDGSVAVSSAVAPSLHAVACVSFELQRFWLHSNPQSVHSSVGPVVQSMVAATSAFHRPQQSHKLPYAYQCASCDLVRLRKGQEQSGSAVTLTPPTDLFSVAGGWQHLTVSTGEYLKSAAGDPLKPRAEDYVFQKAMLSNSIDVAVQAHFRVPTLIGVDASTDPMRSDSYLPFTRSLLPHEWKLQFGVQFNPILLKFERRSLDLINSSLGGFSMAAELDAQEERMQAMLGAGARGPETIEDEEQRAVQQQMLAASSRPPRPLDLTVQIQFPQVLCELLEAKSESVLRLELERIVVAHQQSGASGDADWRGDERAHSAASALVDGSLHIGRLHLIHVRSELDQHRMLTWRQASQESSPSVPCVSPAPVVVCNWSSPVVDVEVLSFDLFVPIDVVQLIVQVCQPIIHPSQLGLINSAPQAATTVNTPAPRRRKYRANAQTLKLLVHSGRVGIGSIAAGRAAQCVSLQWQTVFVLQSASQCDALWQHSVLSDLLEVRVVDVESAVGVASSSHDPFPSSTCIAPFTCVMQLNYRTKIATVDAVTAAQLASWPSLLNATPRTSFVPFYRDLQLTVRIEEIRVCLGFDQIAVVHALARQLVGLSGAQEASTALSTSSASSPRLSSGSSGVARVLFEDDFRTMKADGVGSESASGSPPSASIRLRAGHVAFMDEPHQRVMIWKYSSPRSISGVAVRAIVDMRGSEAGASSLLLGVLSAFDPLLSAYTPVFDLLVDIQRDQYSPLPSTAIVAEEWKLTWTAPTVEHARSWAKQQGKYQRWSELINDTPSRPTLLPSSLELGQIVRVDSQLQYQYGLNVHLSVAAEHVRLALAEQGADKAPAAELAIVHVQGARAGGQLWLRQPINESESLTSVGSALALSVVADALWIDLLQLKDLTHYPVMLPLALSTRIRNNELAVLAPSESGGLQFNHVLPVSLFDRRERGWCVSVKADQAKFNVGLKVLLTAKLIAQRMQECLSPSHAVPLSSGPSVPASAHYVLSNRSGLPLRYGQVGTREDVALPAGADHSYSWASMSATLAHPVHSPPQVLNAFQPHTEPLLSPVNSDARLRYHWMRLSSADVPAWSQAFMIDAPPTAAQAHPLRHVFVYRLFDSVQSSTRSQPSAGSALTPATPSIYAPRVMSSVHVSVVFVSVSRRGLHTLVTFLPSHSLINRLPFSLSARCFTDTRETRQMPPTLPPAATASSPEFGFGLESRRIELESDSATPLPLWYPCPPPQHALLYPGAAERTKQAGKQATADPIVPPPLPRTLRVLLRVHADSAPYLGRPLPQARSPPEEATQASRFPHTALPQYSELWEWADAAAIPLDALGSYLVRSPISPPPLLAGRRSDCRLCVVKHKLDLSQRLFFWAQLSTQHEMPVRSAPAATVPTAQAFVLPSTLSPWQLTLSPAFVFHNPLSQPLTVHLSSASYAQWNAAQSSAHSATDRWGMWLHTAAKLDAAVAAAAIHERHAEDATAASMPLLQSPLHASSPSPPPLPASLQEVLEQGIPLEANCTLPIMHIDPSLQVSCSLALSGQQQTDGTPCSFSATTHLPSNSAALPESSGMVLRSVALHRAAYASSASESRTQLHMLLSADSPSGASPSPTLRVSFAAPLKLHNLCDTPMLLRSHDSISPPLAVPALTPPTGVDSLQLNVGDTPRLCIGVQSNGDAFWSQPFSTRVAVPKKSSPSSAVVQSDYELDVLSVRGGSVAGSVARPSVLLHQFVVSVVKEVLAAVDPAAAPIVCPAANSADPCRLLTCAVCAPSLAVLTHVWIKPRFVVHNRTGSVVRMQQAGTIASPTAAVSLSPGEIRSLEAWHPSARDHHYDAKAPHECGPSISLSFASDDWLWSRPLTVLDECPRSRVSVYNARCGYQRLITFIVLKHRRVRHLLLFHDAQPPLIISNRTPLPIELREHTAERSKRQRIEEAEALSSVVAPAQCSELSLSQPRAHSRSSSEFAAPSAAGPSPPPDSDDEDLSDSVSVLSPPFESGWEGEERIFDHKQTLNRLVMRIAGPPDASAASEPRVGLWSAPVLLKPGEYSLTLPAPSPSLPAVQARVAVAVRNGSIVLILDALDDAGRMLITPHTGGVAPPDTFEAEVQIAAVVVSLYDEESASVTSNLGSAASRGASQSSRGGTPKKSVAEKGGPPSSSLDSMGELLLTLSLDHVQFRSQLTGEQPLQHFLPIITATAAGSNAAPRRLTPLPSSIVAQLYTAVELQIGGVQLDNELEAELPVVLFSFNSTPAYSSAPPQPALKLVFVSAVPLTRTPLSLQLRSSADLQLLSLQLASLGVNVEDRLGFRLASVGLSLARHLQYDFSLRPDPAAAAARSPSVSSAHADLQAALGVSAAFEELLDKLSASRLFVHYVHIGELDFRVTVKAGAGARVFLGAEQMPVRLDAVSLQCVLCSPDRLVQELAANYLASAIVRSPLLLGSLDLLGNPTFLLQSISAGVRDLLFLPRNALPQGPRAFVRAVGGGLLSLLRHTTEGTLISVSGFSSSLARNMERLSGADLFTLQRQVMRLKRPDGIGVGIVSGVKSLSQGVIGGLLGVIAQPIAGAASGGVSGFFAGVGSGLVGVVSKPLSGMFDLVSATSQGLAHTSGVDSVAYTQRFVRRGDSQANSIGSDPHCYHRFSSLKLRQIAAQLGEAYLAHAVVMFAPVAALPTPAAAPASSSAPTSPHTPQSSAHAAFHSSIAREGQFALLLLTDVGIRLCHDDRVTHSFQWNDVEMTHVRTQQAAEPPITNLQAWLDQRARTEWAKYGAAGPSGEEEKDNEFRDSSVSIAPLSFDLLSIHSSRADSVVVLWVPRSIRPGIMLTASRARARAHAHARAAAGNLSQLIVD